MNGMNVKGRMFKAFLAIFIMAASFSAAKAQTVNNTIGTGEHCKAGNVKYKLVTHGQAVLSGDYIINYGNYSAGSQTSATAGHIEGPYAYNAVLTTVSNNSITSTNVMVVRLTKIGTNTNTYTLYNTSSEKYIDVDESGLVETTLQPSSYWQMSWDGTNNDLINFSRKVSSTVTYYIRYNNTSGNQQFGVNKYASPGSSHGTLIRLFKKVTDIDVIAETVSNGTITVSNDGTTYAGSVPAYPEETVYVNLSPDAGYEYVGGTLTATANNTPLSVTFTPTATPNVYTFTVPANTTTSVYVSAEFETIVNCFDFEDVAGTNYYTEGNLPSGWFGYVTNTSSMVKAPHVVNGDNINYPYDGVQSLLLASGDYTNSTAFVAMPARRLSDDLNALGFYYKTNSGIGVLDVGYLTALPSVQSYENWTSAFNMVTTLPCNEVGVVEMVDLSSVPTDVDVYIAFKWYCQYPGILAYNACCIDGLCVKKYVRLWTEAVTSLDDVPTGGFVVDGSGNVTINCKEGLAWLISYVNGFNNASAHDMSGKTVTLTADIDMSDYIWVPIGFNATTAFKGTFDGRYHTIDGIHIKDADEIGYVEGSHGTMQYTGLFGYVVGDASEKACVKNTFVTSGTLCNNYYVDSEHSGYLGGLVGSVAGDANIEFCETAMSLKALSNIAAAGGTIGFLSNSTSTVKACMSMCDIDMGEYGTVSGAVGGVVGQSLMAAVNNCFGNSTITGSAASKGAVIGLAVSSTVKNLYAHPSSTGATHVASNSPNIYAVYEGGYSNATTFSISDYSYGKSNNIITGKTISLVDTLNSQIPSGDGYRWVRAAGSSINGGYPIVYPVAADSLACVSKTGSKAMRFGELNAMLSLYADSTGYEVFMYNNDSIFVVPGNSKLYIDEKVALKQDDGISIPATVSITLDNSKGSGDLGRDWHMFSSSLEAANIGINYGSHQSSYTSFSTEQMNFGTSGDWDYNIEQGDKTVYFPDGITASISDPGRQFDLYAFCEPEYHWINLKRATNNHWHEDEPHAQITSEAYTNETTFTQGKGYMVGLGNNSDKNNNLMQAEGTLTNAPIGSSIDIDVTATDAAYLKGYNLLGNPFQSYLDFEKFVSYGTNATKLWSSGEGTKAFLIYDADEEGGGGFVEYFADGVGASFSHGAEKITNQYIHPHQGFFVVKNSASVKETVSFDNSMRSTEASPKFRDDVLTYPLVNLHCTDSDGKWEHSVIELDRPMMAGSLKMKGMLNGKGQMYIRWNNDDFRSIFIDHTPDYVPVWFEAAEDGVFTMSWNTANADFGYMHLVDNMTGNDIDCLVSDSYTFEALTTDMIGRFRLVFSPLGISETEGEGNGIFAFVNGNELVVTGEGELSLIDMNGRLLTTEHVSGQQSHIALPKVAVGMYMLRLSNANNVKVQKIVVRK